MENAKATKTLNKMFRPLNAMIFELEEPPLPPVLAEVKLDPDAEAIDDLIESLKLL